MDNTLEHLRKQIDSIDSALLELLEKRMEVTDQVGAYKKEHHVPILQPEREAAQRTSLSSRAKHPVLQDTVGSVFQKIIDTSKFSMQLMHSPDVPFQSVGIIGLGVMGGSLVRMLKLKSKTIRIATLTRNSQDTSDALASRIVDTTYKTLPELMNAVELLIIASPVDTVIPVARDIAAHQSSQKKKLIVIDIASVKEKIAAAFGELSTSSIEFVATHPMAGSDQSGFKAANARILLQKPWIICAHANNHPHTIQLISDFVDSCTSRPVMISGLDHDKAVAVVSHLVFILSTYIFAFPFDTAPRTLELAGRGFETTTRLASASPSMHQQIIMHNVVHIQQAIQGFISFLQQNPINQTNLLEFFEKYKKGRDEFVSRQ